MNDTSISFSNYGRLISTPSPVSRMMAAFAHDFRDGMDINLGAGYVDEQTLPRDAMRQALAVVLSRDDIHIRPLNYGGPDGSANLIRAIGEWRTRAGRGFDSVENHRVIIGANGATSLLNGLAEVMEPGIVITSDPRYYVYCDTLERRGFTVRSIPEDNEGLDVERLVAIIKELGDAMGDIRFIYAVTVNNPTGVVMSNARRRALLVLAGKLSHDVGHPVPLICDTAYEMLIHGSNAPHPESLFQEDAEGLYYEVGTLSKILAPALRTGYLAGPRGPLMNAMVQNTSDTGFSAPLVCQEMAAWMLDNIAEEQTVRVNAAYRDKANHTREAITQYLGEHVEAFSGGDAGFYYYLTLDAETHEQSPFHRFLSRSTGRAHIDGPMTCRRPRVSYLPGVHCVQPSGSFAEVGKRQLRLSYGYEDTARITEGLRLMGQAAAYARRS